MRQHRYWLHLALSSCLLFVVAGEARAQSVCLPAPRLLTVSPMGGQVGTTLDVTITGESLEEAELLRFSTPHITAEPLTGDDGQLVADRFRVTIGADCPPGVYDARVLCRRGISSPRAFHVGTWSELVRASTNTTLDTAMPVTLGSVVNATLTRQAVDFYSFPAQKGQRVVIDCAAGGIDSKAKPVLILADEAGGDLVVERRGGAIDATIPADGTYIVKVHDLTFGGGNYHYYRLVLQTAEPNAVVARLPKTRPVHFFSWPPPAVDIDSHVVTEAEPNNDAQTAQRVTLPCDVQGSFAPAADVDLFEFTGQAGDEWWVEVASHRLGRPTDPSIVVQKVIPGEDGETLTDIVELSDIPSPVTVSTNHYTYNGPPYNAGSTDILGKLTIAESGTYRIRLHDLFGGTRNDPRNKYRLIVRKAEPDFAVVGWRLHMQLRNGDRNALSKPLALRPGVTVPIEVVVIRRDGFTGPVELLMDNLPAGVTASGLTIAAGASRGILLLSAAEDATDDFSTARFVGRATIGEQVVTRDAHLATMAWPVRNAWSEIPSPRLVDDIPVSVSAYEPAALTIAATTDDVLEVVAGESLTIPLALEQRSEISGQTLKLKTFGCKFERNPDFDITLDDESPAAVVNTATTKTPPGEYTLAFYGSMVVKYAPPTPSPEEAEAKLAGYRKTLADVTAELEGVQASLESATETERPALQDRLDKLTKSQEIGQKIVASAEAKLKQEQTPAKPKDTAEIVVSQPIRVRVLPQPAETK